ncbi:MAG: HD domain-containing protein [Clostridia bacterium]|nr:HD domain-containing protein [Clostridia bacterium]
MEKVNIKNVLLYGGKTREEFNSILQLVWRRNRRILRVTSLLSALMGFLFLIIVLVSRSGTQLPYMILLVGSLIIYVLTRLTERRGDPLSALFLCYGQMLLVCVYAGILSTRETNYAIPATSIVVFIALLPLSIDDRLIRMFPFMIFESAAYLLVSKLFKSPAAFSLDIMNVVTFLAIGMVMYAVISIRNIREIYQSVRIERIQRSIISSMATVVEERDESTGGHIKRTEDYVRGITENMRRTERYRHLTDDFYYSVMLAAPMHDIGKIKVPDAILNKPARLTPEEYEIIKKHSVFGAEIIEKTMRGIEEPSYFTAAYNIAKYHHERFDGEGYPEGLKGEDIPLEARIMALADVYDALVSERVYKKAFTKEEARAIIEEGSGTQFDPELARLFLKYIDETD